MKNSLCLDSVITQSAPVLESHAGEDVGLVFRLDAPVGLDASLDGVDGVRGLNVQRDAPTGQRLDQDPHAWGGEGMNAARVG